jgi:two-component system, NarL family, sensor kinase
MARRARARLLTTLRRFMRRHGTLTQFALSSAALLALVATIGAVTLKHLATGEALSDARLVTVAVSHGVLEREVTPGVLHGDPAALARLDRTVHEAILGRPIVRVKVWTPDGRVVYSDAHGLIGQRFPLPEDMRAALREGAVRADVSDLVRPENRLERGEGKLVEVYLPLRLLSGRLVLVEAYHPAGQIDAASRRIWRTFLPMFLGLLLALAAAQLPLVWSQARRARADAHDREELAREAEHALQAERGRIATEIHEGVVQDLAGAAYELHAAATLAPGTPEDELRGALGRGADVCRRTMTRMRELLVDLRSEEHRVQDLQSAIEAIVRPLRDAGVEVIVGLALSRPLPGETALLVHRAAREILLDVRRRPDVSLVTMKIEDRGDQVTLTVDHNVMPGPAEGERENGRRPRLDSLAQTLRGRGGSLVIDARDGVGARYAASVPPPV